MPLNKSKGNMYPFVTHTWNPIKGKCPHDCYYCYMKRWGKQSPLHFDEREMKTDLGAGNFIFVGSSCDICADGVPSEWIRRIVAKTKEYLKNKYLFQTKSAAGLIWIPGILEPGSALATTIETNRVYTGLWHEMVTDPGTRAAAMHAVNGDRFEKHITIEPVIDFDTDELVKLVKLAGVRQVNIGADSGNHYLPEPPREKLIELIAELEKFTNVYQKKNLSRLIKERDK